MSKYSELLAPVKAVAHQAGDAIMKIYQGHYCVEQKSDDSPVTEADYAAHEVISNYHPDLDEWVATLIFRGKNRQEVLGKRQQTYDNIRHRNDCS